MPEIPRRILDLLKEDPRYPLDAYAFVQDGLCYAQEVMRLGEKAPTEAHEPSQAESERVDAHLTGQQLCVAIQKLAIEQYGRLARIVLERMGIRSTGDIGEIVYNMIRIREMRKSKTDRREDFDDVYDFVQVFDREFKFEATKA
jgi:uncharacterized repeat protein (TIGR04138 family)